MSYVSDCRWGTMVRLQCPHWAFVVPAPCNFHRLLSTLVVSNSHGLMCSDVFQPP